MCLSQLNTRKYLKERPLNKGKVDRCRYRNSYRSRCKYHSPVQFPVLSEGSHTVCGENVGKTRRPGAEEEPGRNIPSHRRPGTVHQEWRAHVTVRRDNYKRTLVVVTSTRHEYWCVRVWSHVFVQKVDSFHSRSPM